MSKRRPSFAPAAAAVLLAGGLLTSGWLSAQESGESVPMYRVEIIVFENLRKDARPEDPGRPPIPPPPAPDDGLLADDRLTDPVPPARDRPDADTAAEAEPLFFTPVDGFALTDAYARLRRSSAYRPLLHEVWVQPGVDPTLTRPLELSALAQARRVEAGGGLAQPQALDGEVTLYRTRFLHLGLNLSLANEDGGTAVLTGKRRIRSNELHYFDGPELGAIAYVTPMARDATASR